MSGEAPEPPPMPPGAGENGSEPLRAARAGNDPPGAIPEAKPAGATPPAPSHCVSVSPSHRPRPRPDPWSHRRGEPRLFAFLWTLFLFAATGITFMTAVSLGGNSADVMRPATRALLALTGAGVVLLWPMVRLSQAPDEHPI